MLSLQPCFPAALNNLGLCLQALGRTEAAVVRFREALRIQPGFSMSHNNLAMALHSLGQTAEALEHFRRCVELDPALAEAHSNLGQLLLEALAARGVPGPLSRGGAAPACVPRGPAEPGPGPPVLGRPAEAKTCYAAALRLDPDRAVACNDMGQIVHEEGKLEESLAWYERSLSLEPDFALAHCDRGVVLEELGDLEAAERLFRAALGGGPGRVEAYYQLATLLGESLPAADLAAMRQLAAEPGLADDERSTVHAGIGLVLDALEDHAGAAEQLRLANALGLGDARRRGRAYDSADHERLIASLIATCTNSFFARVRDFGVETERPIFIVGLPRSGTTLTEQILASHWQVFGAGELSLARDSFESLPRIMNCTDPAPLCLGRLDRETARHLARQHLDRLAALNCAGAAGRGQDA